VADRIYYFLALGGIGLISPYLNLFFVSRGLSGLQVGVVLSIGFVVALFAAPIWAQQGSVLALFTTSLIYFYSIFGTSAAGYVFDTLGPRWLYIITAFGYL
jgi:MFS family permease